MKSKKISSYYSKLKKMDKDYKDNGHFEDQGNEAFIMLLLRYMGYKKPFKDYEFGDIDIPSVEVYTCAETGDWSGLLSFIKESEQKREAEREAQLEKEREKLKKKEIKFNFIAPKKDWSIYGGWVNAYEPVNRGRLGSTQEWKKEKLYRTYY